MLQSPLMMRYLFWTGMFLASLSHYAGSIQAAPADDEYTLGLTLYGQKRWQLAAETLATYVQKYPEHDKVPLARLYLAQSYVNQQQYRPAREILRQFIKLHDKNKNMNQARYRVAECSYFLDDFPAAIAEFEVFLKNSPQDPLTEWAYPYLADAYLRHNQPKQAAATFQKSLEKFPQGRFLEDSRFGLARSYELDNQPQLAIAEYGSILEIPNGKRVPEAMMNQGMLHFQQQNYPQAVTTFESYLQQFPGNALAPLAQLNAGYAHYSMKQWNAAQQFFEQASQSPAYQQLARYWLAQVGKSQNQYDAAVEILTDLKQTVLPADLAPRVSYQLADSLFQLRKFSDAQSEYERYLQTWPQGEQIEAAWLHAIEAALLAGQIGAGIKLAETAPTTNLSPAAVRERQLLQARLLTDNNEQAELPANWPARSDRLQQANKLLASLMASLAADDFSLTSQQLRFTAAQVEQELGNFQNAVDILEPLTNNLPESQQLLIPEAWLLLATSQLELKQFTESLQSAEQLSSLSARPLRDETIEQLQLLKLTCLLELGNLDQAAVELDRLRELDRDPQKRKLATYQLAEACYARERWNEAAKYYQFVVDDQPDDEWKQKAMSGLGWARYEAGDYEQAVAVFEKLQQSFPNSAKVTADAGYMQGMAKLKANQPQQAAEQFLQTAEKFRSAPADVTGNETNFVAYRAAREAARTYRDLKNWQKSAAAYHLAATELEKQPVGKNSSLDKLLDEWALLHYELEQYPEADEIFQQLVDKCPNSDRADDALLSLAESDFIGGQLPAARQRLLAVLAVPQADSYVKRRARFQLVQIGVEQKDTESIEKYCREYLNADDLTAIDLAERGEVEFQQIQLLLDQNENDQAELQLKKLLPQSEVFAADQAPAWVPGLFVQQAELARRKKDYAQVRELQATMEQKFPETAERDQLDVLVGRTFISQADFNSARQQFQRVIDRQAGKKNLAGAQSQFFLAETALIEKNYELALKEYLRMAVLFPGFPELQTAALFQAGQCDEVLGHVEQAISNYENLVKLFPESEFAAKAEVRIKKLKPNP